MKSGWLKAAERLEKVAVSLRKQAEPKLDPGCGRQNLTPRRADMASRMIAEGRRLEELAAAAESLAREHRSDQIDPPTLLEKIRTAKDLATVRLWGRHDYDTPAELPNPLGGYAKDRKRLVLGLGITSNAKLAEAAALLAARFERREPTREEKVRELERSILGVPIPGFFPTPEPVGRRMVELAGIMPGSLVLEPSAGKGDLIELALEAGATVRAVEISTALLAILEARFSPPDVVIIPGGFLGMVPRPRFDAVLMNPPFEKGADADHIRLAYAYLRPGGTLVAIASEGLFFREDTKAREFREWLRRKCAFGGERLEPGAFTGAESFRQTGVAARIVVIEREPDETAADRGTRVVREVLDKYR